MNRNFDNKIWYRHHKKQETNCLIKLTGKSAKLKCSKFFTLENREIEMLRKNGVLQYSTTEVNNRHDLVTGHMKHVVISANHFKNHTNNTEIT